jgi:uncharacterized protein
MAGMHASNGRRLDEVADIVQSVTKILTTPIGSRVMRRTFGSAIFDLVDSPVNPVGALRLIAATADAIERWERRISLRSAQVTPAIDGKTLLRIDATVTATGRALTMDIPLGALA